MSTSSPLNPLDLLKNKKRGGLNITKVIRKADGTVERATAQNHARVVSQPSTATDINGTRRLNGSSVGKNSSPKSSISISRQSSKESIRSNSKLRNQRPKKPTPTIVTPQFTDSDDTESEAEARRKRVKVEQRTPTDANRTIRDMGSFVEGSAQELALIHAADIANSETQEHGRYKYAAFFTTLTGDEDECPTVDLQYPSAIQSERYQLVNPTDPTDFRPLSEIIDNMRIVSEFYVDPSSAEIIMSEELGSGMIEKLQKFARDGDKGRPGAQSKFVEVIDEYNDLLTRKRKDGTVAKHLDGMKYVPLKIVEHIVKNQVYSRTVSPQVNLVRQYEGFSDNVYGELLPKFLSDIFKITKLKSEHVFVDLGSGVGNCVLQAAMETGCQAWGCEMMANCAKLAKLQAQEFVPRCRMWGIKPGKVSLIEGDFLTNEKIKAVLKRADVVLINNQAFTPQLNNELKYMFLDFKEGCQIISLKPYRDPTHKIKETNINDPVNVLSVVEKERFSGMVSWTDDPGKWYLQVKDSTALQRFTERLKRRG